MRDATPATSAGARLAQSHSGGLARGAVDGYRYSVIWGGTAAAVDDRWRLLVRRRRQNGIREIVKRTSERLWRRTNRSLLGPGPPEGTVDANLYS
jgi:hypothetical protein